MDDLLPSLIDFQTMLVLALAPVTALAIVLIGFGMIVSGAAPTFGYRLQRLGLQIIGGAFAVVFVHAVLIELYGARVPLGVLVAVYGLVALLLLQGALNLLFGPAVGNRVVATLLGSLIVSLIALALQPFRLLRDLFR